MTGMTVSHKHPSDLSDEEINAPCFLVMPDKVAEMNVLWEFISVVVKNVYNGSFKVDAESEELYKQLITDFEILVKEESAGEFHIFYTRPFISLSLINSTLVKEDVALDYYLDLYTINLLSELSNFKSWLYSDFVTKAKQKYFKYESRVGNKKGYASNKIRSITFIEANNKHSANKFYVNEELSLAKPVSKKSKAMNLLFELEASESNRCDYNQEVFTYINHDKKCTLYYGSRYSLTPILIRDENIMRINPDVDVKIIKNSQYKSKMTKLAK